MPRKAGKSGSAGGRRKRPCPGRDLAGGLPDGTPGSVSGLGKRIGRKADSALQSDSTTYADPEHQLCCAHALRELQGVADCAAAGDWCWATQAADALVGMQKLVSEAIEQDRDAVEPAALAAQIAAYRSAAVIGINQTAARSSKLMRKHNALAHRLIDRQDDYLRFTTDWRVTADNNGCERDIRMIKLRQKVSGGLRTLAGARQFCALRSYLSTAAKHGLHFFEALVMLTEGRPWTPAAA